MRQTSSLAELITDDPDTDYKGLIEEKKNRKIWEDKDWKPENYTGIGPTAGDEGVPCAIWGCNKLVQHTGLCSAHYRYWRRNGTEALNRKTKRIPQTREEAIAFLQIRAIEFADAVQEGERSGTETDVDRASKQLIEAGLLLGDPEARRRYSLLRRRTYQRKRREAGLASKSPWKGKDGKTFRERYIEQNGIEAWRAYKRLIWERWRDNYIAKHGEQAYKERTNAAARRYWKKKKERQKIELSAVPNEDSRA